MLMKIKYKLKWKIIWLKMSHKIFMKNVTDEITLTLIYMWQLGANYVCMIHAGIFLEMYFLEKYTFYILTWLTIL